MKKLSGIIVAALLAVSMVSCGTDKADKKEDNSANDTVNTNISENQSEETVEDEQTDDAKEITDETVTEETKPDETENTEEPVVENKENENAEMVVKSFINKEALDELEAKDDFDIQIVEKGIFYGNDTRGISNSDELVLTVKNNGSKDVTYLNVYVVGYKEDMSVTTIQAFGSSYVTSFKFVELGVLKPGETYDGYCGCLASKFENVKAIVASYTDADGNIVENPWASEWLKLYQVSKEVPKEEPEEVISVSLKNKINVEALKAIQDKDTSKVTVSALRIEEDIVEGVNLAGNDVLCITLANNGSKDVTSALIYVLGYKEDYEISYIQNDTTFGTSYDVCRITVEDLSIKAGESAECFTACNSELFDGVYVLVASYTTADGTVYENPITEEWTLSYKEKLILE